ncbi:hypothetical protein DUI87_29816 [Hirundo rustica rustica]|uniref:Peptidase A2 domain-containing protein n=1 Tax=Hirundo rustica rustica TaxID=333673 RepID=A0A3M0IY41_HIRRU|nr:hypothetical protein DUI87_29816 [Hirundo rustica rustica]
MTPSLKRRSSVSPKPSNTFKWDPMGTWTANTGNDVAIITRSEWPWDWELTPIIRAISGIREAVVSMRSRHPIIIEGPKRQVVTIRPFVSQLSPRRLRAEEAGFEIQEKIQRTNPWAYLGLHITERNIVPQQLVIKDNVKTLRDLHQLFGSSIGCSCC